MAKAKASAGNFLVVTESSTFLVTDLTNELRGFAKANGGKVFDLTNVKALTTSGQWSKIPFKKEGDAAISMGLEAAQFKVRSMKAAGSPIVMDEVERDDHPTTGAFTPSAAIGAGEEGERAGAVAAANAFDPLDDIADTEEEKLTLQELIEDTKNIQPTPAPEAPSAEA